MELRKYSKIKHRVFLVFILLYSVSVAKVPVKFQLLEERDPGEFIGYVIEEAIRSGAIAPQDPSRLTLALTSDYFRIEEIDQLVSKVKIDREQDGLCSTEDNCVLTNNIFVYKEGTDGIFDLITIEVTIIDINDNAPTFPSPFVELKIAEGNELKHVLRTVGAVDKDSKENTVAVYRFKEPNDVFSLSVKKNPDDSLYLGIIAEKKLDRETKASYQMTVIATDRGEPKREGEVKINITVTDINDNQPEFLQTSYNESVDENVDTSYSIMQVQAKDLDEGENAEISYLFSSGVSSSVKQKLYLDEITGEIYAKNVIDYEEQKQFQFTVEAVDNGTPQNTARVAVTLNINDKNDNDPEINTDANLPSVISELENPGKIVTTVFVHDADSGINGKVQCSMKNDFFSLENLYEYAANKYKVLLKKNLDFEKKSRHKVTIKCTDSGRPARSSSASFTLDVIDENDEHPVFTESIYYGNITENRRGQRELLTVSAHDLDSGEFGTVSYSVEVGISDTFAVDPSTGIVKVLKPLDREEKPVYEFHVIARDNGPERLSSSALVIIKVEDENDRAPEFRDPIFFGDILENQPLGTEVGKVVAIDKDDEENAKFIFSIDHDTPDAQNFTIDPFTGEVFSAVVFDRELKDQYRFHVRVTDAKKARFTNTCNFTVRIIDDNDHKPVIRPINLVNSTAVLQYPAQVGSEIITIEAFDMDDPNSRHSDLHYFIESGDPRQLFNLNLYTGRLTLARIITPKDIKIHMLTVRVTDSGDPPKYDTQTLRVIVNGTIPTSSKSSSISQNMLIVVILIGVTIVVILAIIATICLIRKIDRDKKRRRTVVQQNSEDKMYQLKKHDIYLNNAAEVEDANSNNLNKKNGRKEVSFSMDEESDSHNTSMGSGQPLTSFRATGDKHNTSGVQPRSVSGSMNIPVIHNEHQVTTARRSPQDEESHLIQILKKSTEDAFSASSGESDPSDSGRGGSEDDSSHRGSGVDHEHNNGVKLYHQVLNRGPTQTTDDIPHNYGLKHSHFSKPSNPYGHTKGRSSRSSQSPRTSMTSDIDSDYSGYSGSRPSQSRSDSSRSSNQNLSFQNEPNMIPSQLPRSRNPHFQNRNLLTYDSPNRLANPSMSSTNINNGIMRSFHGRPTHGIQISPNASVSMERLPRPKSSSSDRIAPFVQSERSYSTSDKMYPMTERWVNQPSLTEEDDRTTTSGSYTVNPDDLRQDIDSLIMHDSIV